NYMTSNEIREKYLNFFKSKRHKIKPSASLVPADPSILLTIAGMVPFKPIFLGQIKSSLKRATTSQKCIRTNDIENVGITARHHTFFEMMGNFSFGDYFKKDAIKWAWEFFTDVIGFSADKLWVSVYKDDDESFKIWHDLIGLPEKKIVRLGEEDNFWKVGPTGPCGPCSEIYIDLGEEKSSGGGGVGIDDRYLELWNLVFMQYNRNEDGSLTPLPKQNIDTGLGLERIASVLQNTETDFETDLFLPIIKFVAKNAGIKYKDAKKSDMALKVIADHIRALTFMIADDIMPSNEGRGYVLRMLLRRAFRYGKTISFNSPFLYEIVPMVIDLMKKAYPEIVKKENDISRIILTEEKRFQETLNSGMKNLESIKEEMKRKNIKKLEGKDAFKLYDTYGFPFELTRDILKEDGFEVAEKDFENEMKIQKERSRKSWLENNIDSKRDERDIKLYQDILKNNRRTEFVGYDSDEMKSKIVAIIKNNELVDEAEEGDKCEIILDKTPFYAEKGGQIGDKGIFSSNSNSNDLLIEIYDTQTPIDGLVVHFSEISKGKIKVNSEVVAKININRRKNIARNHTATHLLQKSLREILGNHIKQAGSAVNNDHLRFDFNHFNPLSKKELEKVEELVNKKILDDIKVHTKISSFDKAKEEGAIAIFGEKYGDKVRIVSIGEFSKELCGGTHLNSTSNIAIFKIVNEQGIGSGLRRIEAVTGERAIKYIKEKENILNDLSEKLQTAPEKILSKFNQIVENENKNKKEINNINKKLAHYEINNLVEKKKEFKGINIISSKVDVTSNNDLRNWGDLIKDKTKSCLIILGAKLNEDKAVLLIMLTDDLAKKGFSANDLIKKIAPIIGGSGGGRKTMAQAGGTKVEGLDKALQKIYEIV
ncbi:MAG: alanine--tRNA ligase, partial [Candidatus Caldatribacteriota bacterium]|nr:alanine--tRNA ligase [Candidatus Caldatribacteriota bacterium]